MWSFDAIFVDSGPMFGEFVAGIKGHSEGLNIEGGRAEDLLFSWVSECWTPVTNLTPVIILYSYDLHV